LAKRGEKELGGKTTWRIGNVTTGKGKSGKVKLLRRERKKGKRKKFQLIAMEGNAAKPSPVSQQAKAEKNP